MTNVLTLVDVQEYMKSFEAERLKAYKCPAGIWTIGLGSTYPNGKPVFPGMTCTHDEAIEWFLQEIRHCELSIMKMVTSVPTIHQVSSFVDIGYNIGTGGLGNSSIIKFHNEGNFEAAGEAILQHNKAKVNGELVELAGLTRRRKYDFRIYFEKDLAALKPLPEEIPTAEELLEIQAAGFEKIQLESWEDMMIDFNNNLPQVPA